MPSLDEMDGKSWIQLLMGHSLQDLIVIGLPYMMISTAPIITASFVYDPTMKLLIYSMVPESWKNWQWFCACFTAEIHFMAMFPAIATTAWQLQVISFELVNTNLETIVSAAMKR